MTKLFSLAQVEAQSQRLRYGQKAAHFSGFTHPPTHHNRKLLGQFQEVHPIVRLSRKPLLSTPSPDFIFSLNSMGPFSIVQSWTSKGDCVEKLAKRCPKNYLILHKNLEGKKSADNRRLLLLFINRLSVRAENSQM
jgi:hypothetical protein